MDNIKFRLDWPKSEDEIWDETFEHLDERSFNKNSRIPAGGYTAKGLLSRTSLWDFSAKGLIARIPVWGYAAGLLIPLLLICCLYTKTVETAKGNYSTVVLPDQSTVKMNAESKVSYKPLVWYISRKVELQGEAYFEVKAGSTFCVRSGRNGVKVLGTSFNVYARPGMYCVTCLSGQVEVQAGKNTAILNRNMQAVISEPEMKVNSDVSTSTVTGWINGQFVFVKTPLKDVIAEVERQYDISVTPNYDPNRTYSGVFSKTTSPESVLAIIGKSLEITLTME
jgi:ferric-dicitrate binding protein FerR (iron transport regulator)